RGIEMTPLGGQLKHMRDLKDEREVACIQEAARISEEALEHVLQQGLVGRTEAEVAFDLEVGMRRRGADAVSFELIVASGPRSAMPHGTASSRVIGKDEVVIIDFGCIYRGYCSDQTVTVLTGRPPDGFEEVYRAVDEARLRALKAVTPGMRASDMDRIARGHLGSRGLDTFFGHGLGHGVGMEVHESPTISSVSEDTLEEGMVFTVEPGVYLPGRFGVRLEDMAVVSDSSCKLLTNIDKGIVRIIDRE
ncbi:MAG TPA: M24 family metallopeptidase, partial [Deltaproteobacteria bacterium]|nr:M24 family metallopeptidase [Deltaproteobacteria bacterium]